MTDTSTAASTGGPSSGVAAPAHDGAGRHELASDRPAGTRGDPGEDRRGDGGGGEPLRHTSIVLRPLASPLPLGLFAFSIGSFVLGLAQLGAFSPGDLPTTYLLLAVFVAVPQFVAAIVAFLAREPVAATLLGLLALSWPTQYAVSLATTAPTSAPRGALFLALAFTLVALSLPGLTAKPVLSGLLLAAAARFVAGGLYDLTASPAWERVSGVIALVVVVVGAYLALALVYEDVRHRTVLPVGRRGESRTAMEGGLAEQERALPQEAGVRAQL